MSVLDRYRASWPRVGAVIAMGSAGALVIGHRRMSKPQLLSALNMLALLVHQYEDTRTRLLPRPVQRRSNLP
jgi:hypothetical protein